MALLTMIARVIDGLPLVGTMQDDEQVRRLAHKTHTHIHLNSFKTKTLSLFVH